MAPRRPPDFRLDEALADPAFTPRGQDLPALVELLGGDEEGAAAVERGLLRLGSPFAAELEQRARAAAAPLRGRLVRVLGQLAATEPALIPGLVAWSADADPRARRNAIIAMGKLAAPDAEARLRRLAADPATSPPDRRAAVEALGKVGTEGSLATIAAIAPGDDAELARLVARARVRIERTALRTVPSSIDDAARPDRPLPVLLQCRAGLEELLAEEIPGSRPAGRGVVRVELRTSLAELFRARLFLDAGFPLPAQRGDEIDAIARALTSREAAEIFARFTRGPIRYRIAWSHGGHRRATVLKVALAVGAARPDLVNDPTDSPWEARVAPGGVTLVPRLPDPRFAYRIRDVPAASHPTIAAALARVAGVRADDVVWDPFVGSGTELVERARLGPYRALHGTDLDERALAVAAENLAAAGVRATLERRDALAGPPSGTTLVITNPPMGRRLLREPGAAERLLERLLDVAARDLLPGARIAWVSPAGERTAARAARAGFHVESRRVVDLGGFSAELQLLISRPRPST